MGCRFLKQVGLSSPVAQGLRRLVLSAWPRGRVGCKGSIRSNFLGLFHCRFSEGSAPQAVEDPVQRGALLSSYSTDRVETSKSSRIPRFASWRVLLLLP